ncbi:ATP-binding cassette domain-containing protein [Bdellovibrionota bacterium FG-2]
MISLKAVSKSYSDPNRVLDHINLELKRGDFLYVLGGTGAGKSTLLRMLATEETPTQGILSLFGYPISATSASSLQTIRKCLGYIPQDIRLIPDLSVYDNIALSVSLAGRSSLSAQSKSTINGLLDRLGLAGKRDKPASVLSGGEAQRVAVVRALARSPELIIADEPTGAQDQEFTWSLMDLFLKASIGGTTVVIATHDKEIVRRVPKPCAVLKGGRMLLESKMEEAWCTY